jgi:hypothetical protein
VSVCVCVGVPVCGLSVCLYLCVCMCLCVCVCVGVVCVCVMNVTHFLPPVTVHRLRNRLLGPHWAEIPWDDEAASLDFAF